MTSPSSSFKVFDACLVIGIQITDGPHGVTKEDIELFQQAQDRAHKVSSYLSVPIYLGCAFELTLVVKFKVKYPFDLS